MSGSREMIKWNHTYSLTTYTGIQRSIFMQQEWKASTKPTKSGDCKNGGRSQNAHRVIEKMLTEDKATCKRLQTRHIWKGLVNHLGRLTISTGKMIFLLTVRRPHHNRKYDRLLEEILTDINSSCITTAVGHQDNSSKKVTGARDWQLYKIYNGVLQVSVSDPLDELVKA
jgi:hypothetical protein